MAKNTLIIEIEEKLVKVCLSAKKGNKANVSGSFMFQAPERAVVDGQIVDTEALASAINAHLLRNNITKIKKVVFALTSTKVINKEVSLPAVKEKRIRTVIETNANEYFPVDMSNYQVAYDILEKSKTGYRVLVLAVPQMMVNGYIRLANELNLNIEAIDFSGNSQYQAVKKIKDEQVVAYLDCNLTNTFVNFIENGSLVMQRSFQVGVDKIISTFMKNQMRNESMHLASLQDLSKPDIIDVVFSAEERKQSADRFLHNVERIMDFFKANYEGKQISQIVLLGTYSSIAGLKDMVQEVTNIPTVLLHEKEGVEAIGADAKIIDYYISCIGAQLKPVDFLPEEYKHRKKKSAGSTKTGKMVLVASLLISAVLCGYQGFMYYTSSEELSTLKSKLYRLEKVQEIYDTYVQYERINGHISVLDDLKHTPNAELVAFFEELEAKMPSEITVLSAVCNDTNVSMNVTVSNLEEAGTTIAQLRNFETIQDITVSGISETEDRAGRKNASFSITCTYNLDAFKPAEEAAQ